MSCIGTAGVTSISRMSKSLNLDYLVPLNNGMYEPDLAHTVPLAIIPRHPYKFIVGKMALDIFPAQNYGFSSRHHLPCDEYSSIN